MTFTVSMQPGNNYRAGASLLQDALNQGPTGKTMQNVADALSVWTDEFTDENGPQQIHYPYGHFSDYSVPLVWSEMLTVWRKLHVELDSMGSGTSPSAFADRNLDDTGIETDPDHSSHSWAEVNGFDGSDADVQNGQLEGGTLTVTGGGTYTIVDNIDVFIDDDVYVEGDIRPDEDKLATAVDDDAPFVPRKADISLMAEKFKPAYIEIEEHPEESQLNLPFVANLTTDPQGAVDATAPGRSATFLTSPDFWVVQIVTCYQGTENSDHDPDDVYHFWTGTDLKNGESTLYAQTVPSNFSSYNNVSMIFLETIRDRSAWSVFFSQPIFNNITALLNAGDVERITVVHEVGHQFGLMHTSTGLMDGNGVEDPSLDFAAADLNTIRNSSAIAQP